MIDNSSVIPIDSDVLVAAHHGADNGSSTEFINAVSPTTVIFSAGNRHGHPRETTANRYLAILAEDALFRTDRGGNETGNHGDTEWKQPPFDPDGDTTRDDDIDITISPSGDVTVAYREM